MYGTTWIGGNNNGGIVFSVGADGTNYQILHSFAGGSNQPTAGDAPLVSGSTLYGMTTGAPAYSPVIYEMNTDGTGYYVLHTGVGGLASLTLSGSTLYGVGNGEVFRINTDGSDFHILQQKLPGRNLSGVTLFGSTLYGVTSTGGDANDGTIFSLNTDGTGYQILHSFVGGSNDGTDPVCAPLVIGSVLYGATLHGGGALDCGVIYSMPLPIPEPSTLVLLGIGAVSLLAYAWRKRTRMA